MMNSTDFRRKCRDDLVERFNMPDARPCWEGYCFKATVFDEQGCESKIGFGVKSSDGHSATAVSMKESDARDMVCDEGVTGAARKIADGLIVKLGMLRDAMGAA